MKKRVPVFQAGNLELLRQSKNPIEQTLADLVQGQTQLVKESQLLDLNRRIIIGLNDIQQEIHSLKPRSRKVKASLFYGVGPSTYRHKLDALPSFVVFLTKKPAIIKYDSVSMTSTDVRVECEESIAFVGIALANAIVWYPEDIAGSEEYKAHQTEASRILFSSKQAIRRPLDLLLSDLSEIPDTLE